MNLSVSLGTSTGQASIRKNNNFKQSIPEPPSPRKSRTRSSPSKLRRNRARAQVYHGKKKLEFEKVRLATVSDKNVSCAQDYQLCSKDDDVDNEPEENEKSTDDDEDSTFCDSTFDDNSTADEATSSRSDKESDLAYIVLCENFVMELSSHSMYEDCIAFFKNGSTTEHLIEEFHQNFLFKVQFGFDED